MKLNNPSLSAKNMIKKSIIHINKKHKRFNNYIRSYSNFLDKNINDFYKKAEISEDEWYRHQLNFEDKKK